MVHTHRSFIAAERNRKVLGYGLTDNGERLGVIGECDRGAAKHVAGELIQHNHGGKCRLSIGQQDIFGGRGDHSVNIQKAGANLLIKLCTASEPLLARQLGKPKTQHFIGPACLSRRRGDSLALRLKAG